MNVKPLIDEFNETLLKAQKNLEAAENRSDEIQSEIDSIKSTLQMIDCEVSKKVLNETLTKKEESLKYNGISEDSYLQKYNKIRDCREVFMDIMKKHCDHNMKFDHTDYHKNEDYYTCTICGMTR